MPTIDNAIYDRIPDSWWSEDDFMALLRLAVNPPRFAYFAAVLARRAGAPRDLTVLDVGCGGGLLSESFAALGCAVTGIDQSLPTLAAARAHATANGLAIDYREGDALALPLPAAQFDVVCCCDVLEHVDDLDRAIAEIARVLKPGGVYFFDTINRTWRSRLLAITLAQDFAPTRLVPRDLHVWDRFIKPAELSASLARHGLAMREVVGLSPSLNPLRLWRAAWAVLRVKLGRGGYGDLGRAVELRPGRDVSLAYMGYACAPTGAAGH